MEKFTINLIKQAGQMLKKYFRTDAKIALLRGSVKAVTTKYDKIVDRFIIQKLTAKFPTYNLLTEESDPVNKNSLYTFVVDSLDGTVNFACGNPLFSVCLALLKKDEPIWGIIYAPILNELYWAKKNKGAFLNNQRIKTTTLGNLAKSYVYQCEGGNKNRRLTGKMFANLYPRVTDLRKLGSAGLECAWVAAGRAECYLTTTIEPWDVAPGVLLVQEAGGKVTDFQGRPWRAKRSNLIFSNGKVHQQLIKLAKI